MELWIYDENSYPSGFAGGHVPDQMPESYNQGQGIRIVKQSVLQPDSLGRYIHIFKKENDHLVDITTTVANETGSEGEFFVSDDAAKEGVKITNLSKTDPIVMLKHFGPDNAELKKWQSGTGSTK